MTKLRDFCTMTWAEVEADLPLGSPAIPPIGAVEQHGHRLPLTVDDDLATGVARALGVQTGAFVLPSITYGDAWPSAAEKGRALIDGIVENMRPLIDDFLARNPVKAIGK